MDEEEESIDINLNGVYVVDKKFGNIKFFKYINAIFIIINLILAVYLISLPVDSIRDIKRDLDREDDIFTDFGEIIAFPFIVMISLYCIIFLSIYYITILSHLISDTVRYNRLYRNRFRIITTGFITVPKSHKGRSIIFILLNIPVLIILIILAVVENQIIHEALIMTIMIIVSLVMIAFEIVKHFLVKNMFLNMYDR